MHEPIQAAQRGHAELLRELHQVLEQRGLFAPSHLWTRKLLIWIPVFFGSYVALMVVPFGVAWLLLAPLAAVAMLTMGFAGHDAGHTAVENLSYLEQQVSTSRNIGNPALLDFYFGGLNSQIEHHLFPRVPHHHYRAMRPIVRQLCEAHGIAYQQQSFHTALAMVGRHLGHMTAAQQASLEPSRLR